ncbi:MAG: IS3 family transposase [Acidimicrobiia bacterium]|nr:IS3 family transposase [Acidimicrobiia bacterium]
MSVVSHIAAQRTDHGVPHALSCRLLGVSESWFYKWRNRQPTPTERRRTELDIKVRIVFETSGRTYGSPRVRAQLRADGEQVSKKTVAASMARQGLVARSKRRRRNLTRPDQAAAPAPDLVRRDFTADRPDHKWCGDFKHIPTQQGPVYLATVEDLYSRRILGFALSDKHPTSALAQAAINMAVATRGGDVRGVIFHTDRGSQYTAQAFVGACRRLGIVQSMGRVGSALDNAPAESFFSTLQLERLTNRTYQTKTQARQDIANWIHTWYNHHRLHSTLNMTSPINYENTHQTT